MEGGKSYLIDRKLDRVVSFEKVHHITNGVDIDEFQYNKENFLIDIDIFENSDIFKVVYTGSIRTANNISFLVDVAKIIQDEGLNEIKFIIYGDGPDREILENRCGIENISNIIFKGLIKKKYTLLHELEKFTLSGSKRWGKCVKYFIYV
jgi:glycosyltransferase involved in cell wall biosynthesis